jgi:multiple sugar transport system substrate-binding protein
LVAVFAAGALTAALAACGGDDGGDGGDGGDGAEGIKVWIIEDLPDRVAATEAIMEDFTAASGVPVELVPVAEDQFSQLITSSAAAGDLPDVIGALPLPQVRTLAANELIDVEAVGTAMEGLDESTFSPNAIELTRDGEDQLAVPSEAWAQMLIYRKDLFDAAGLAAPTSYDAILAAAQELDSDDVAGFVGATAPGDAFTAQTFEHIALGNGCELVDEQGQVLLDTDPCVAAFEFYGNLTSSFSVPGAQDVDTTRASYFAGQAAMLIWSTFVLDEMAGLRNDAMPSCPECADDPAFLAKNSGVVTAIQGPDGSDPAVFGEITSWTVTAGAAADPAVELITYLMNDGYVPWLAIAPEGKVPARAGTPENATQFSDEWAGLEAGVDTKAPLSDFYSPEVLEAVAAAPTNLQRWAIAQGQGDLYGAIQGEQPVADAVNEVSQGGAAQEAAQTAATTVRDIQGSLS